VRRDTQLVGIINITPDSFSDGGETFSSETALVAIKRLMEEGADIVDIGAESTRPGATPVSHEEEWERLEPVLAQLPKGVAVSIDTRHAATARNALAYHVEWINDVSGFSAPEMIDAVKNSDCMLVVMHSLSVPADKNIVLPQDADVIHELLVFARARVGELQKAGIAKERIIFDPGIGFGKTPEQSWEIIRRIDQLKILGMPLLVGHSRKSFLGGEMHMRDQKTLEVSRDLAMRGVDFLRVHNIVMHRRLLDVKDAANG
jgi:dihydropteroate synthase